MKFKSGTLPSPREREILVILAEECAEVQHRICKILRFGLNQTGPGRDKSNKFLLSEESGQLLRLMYMAEEEGLTDPDTVVQSFRAKSVALDKYMQTSQD